MLGKRGGETKESRGKENYGDARLSSMNKTRPVMSSAIMQPRDHMSICSVWEMGRANRREGWQSWGEEDVSAV
jgi:hypothetical protein